MRRPTSPLSALQALLLTLLVSATVHAQDAPQNASLTVYDDSDQYAYHGCYNETTGIEGAGGARALEGGITEVRADEMTVPMCLDFCGKGDEEYRYAGLQWSRECWCSQTLAGIAEELDDDECSFACEGDESMACGGSLKLSVYRLSGSASRSRASGLFLLCALVTGYLLSVS